MARAYYLANVERVKSRTRAAALADPDRSRRYAREWAARNKDKVAATGRACAAAKPLYYEEMRRGWRERNKERIAETRRRWAAQNPDRRRARSMKRRAEVRAADHGCVSGDALRRLFSEYDGCCAYCTEVIDVLHWDHKTPISRGGKHCIDNLAPACASCNLRKYTKTAEEFLAYLAERAA